MLQSFNSFAPMISSYGRQKEGALFFFSRNSATQRHKVAIARQKLLTYDLYLYKMFMYLKGLRGIKEASKGHIMVMSRHL